MMYTVNVVVLTLSTGLKAADFQRFLKISGQNTHKIKSFPQTYPHDVENFFDFCACPWKTTDFKSYLDFLCVFVIISIDVLPFCRINI